jgi:hypothetical protein
MKKIIVFFILVVLGLTLSLICLEETNATSLLKFHDRGVYSSNISGPLIAGKTVRGEFTAAYDNLGMVKLRIGTFNRINTTHITFEIREKGSATTLATNTYATDRFSDGLLYPFGFPIIADSKGKTYEFTISGLDGSRDNSIGIVSGYHDVATQYVFGKTEILSHLSEKIRSIVTDPYMILYISIFLVPAFVYLFKRYGQMLGIYTLLVYTYIPVSMHSNTILVVAASVAGIALFTHTTASRIYVGALMWLVQIPLMLAFGNVLAADRAATLIFFFICIGGIISLAELKKK